MRAPGCVEAHVCGEIGREIVAVNRQIFAAPLAARVDPFGPLQTRVERQRRFKSQRPFDDRARIKVAHRNRVEAAQKVRPIRVQAAFVVPVAK